MRGSNGKLWPRVGCGHKLYPGHGVLFFEHRPLGKWHACFFGPGSKDLVLRKHAPPQARLTGWMGTAVLHELYHGIPKAHHKVNPMPLARLTQFLEIGRMGLTGWAGYCPCMSTLARTGTRLPAGPGWHVRG